MHLSNLDRNTPAGRLRRQAVSIAASSAALTGVSLLAFTHGHLITGAISIGVQASLLTIAFSLMVRLKRLESR